MTRLLDTSIPRQSLLLEAVLYVNVLSLPQQTKHDVCKLFFVFQVVMTIDLQVQSQRRTTNYY